MHSAFGIAYREKFHPLDSNNIKSLPDKFPDVQLIMIDQTSMVSKKLFY